MLKADSTDIGVFGFGLIDAAGLEIGLKRGGSVGWAPRGRRGR